MLRGLKYYCLCIRRTFQHGPGNTLCIHRGATLYIKCHMTCLIAKNNNTVKMHMSKEQLLFTLQMFMLFL